MKKAILCFAIAAFLAAGTAGAGVNSIWVNSFCCSPGETVTVQIHGSVADPSANVEWRFENESTGTVANTPVGSTDSMDVGFVGGTGNPTPFSNGQFWDSIQVTCPDNACAGDAAVYRLTLFVNGVEVDSDLGCVTVWGSKPKTGTFVPVEPAESHVHNPTPGSTQRASYVVTNLDTVPHTFRFLANTINHLAPGEDLYELTPVEGVSNFSFNEGLIEGQLVDLAPGDSTIVSFEVSTLPGQEVGQGNTVNLTVIDEIDGTALNSSSVVFVGDPEMPDEDGTAVIAVDRYEP